MVKFRWVTWGEINGEKVVMLGKHRSHPVVDEEGHVTMFIAERQEPLPYPMTPEEILCWLGKSKQTSLDAFIKERDGDGSKV